MSRVNKLLVAIILVVGILLPTTALASPGATVSITDAILPTGTTGSVLLSISGATEPVSCVDVDVSYDPAVVEVTGASGSDFDSLVSNIENGHTHLVAFVTSQTGLTGTIKVADITLTRLGGESVLTLDVTTLKDDDGSSIPFTVVNGQVTAAPTGTVVSITDAILPTGATGSVALSISGATEPVSCVDVDVSYDPAVVEVIDASSSDFDSLVSNIENGHTHLVAFLASETGLTGTIKVADITLTRLGGESALTLDVITLKDDDGNSIPFTVVNGWVAAAAPPAFSVSNLSIQPLEVQPKEAVTITVSVANTGGTEGSYTVVLMIDGVKETEKSVTVAAGSSEIVSFLVTRADVGSYSVAVDGLSASFTVVPEITGEVVKTVPAGRTDYVVDASAIADTTIKVDTTAEVTITVKKYRSNPHPEAALPASMLPRYIDIEVDNPGAVIWPMYVKQTYTTAEVAGLDESSLGMYYFKAGAWHRCSETGVDTDYVWANIWEKELPGAPVAIGGIAAPEPEPEPEPEPAPPEGEGGGGGGPPALPPGTTDVRGMVSTAGRFFTFVTAMSEDDLCRLTIPSGTVGLTEELEPLTEITMLIMDEPPPPPEGTDVIGLVYDFQPSGATFEPPITLTFTYDEALIPEGVAEESLVITVWDEEAGKWVELDCVVNPGFNTITAEISHLTPFAILAYTRPPAFVASDLSITPAEVDIGQEVTISVLVTNTGDLTDSYEVTLNIAEVVVASEEVTLAGGASEIVTFTAAKDVAGTYAVTIDGLSGTFVVGAPAAFVASDLSITPAEVDIGQEVTISVLVINTGDLTDSYEVTLKIAKVVVASEEVTLAGGASEIVTFTAAKDVAGTYAVTIDGLSGTFVVRIAPAMVVNWPVVGGIIAAVVVVGLLVFFLIRRRAY